MTAGKLGGFRIDAEAPPINIQVNGWQALALACALSVTIDASRKTLRGLRSGSPDYVETVRMIGFYQSVLSQLPVEAVRVFGQASPLPGTVQ